MFPLILLERSNLKTEPADIFRSRIKTFKKVLIDIGTGNAKFPYFQAKAHTDLFCIGIDIVANNMRIISNRIGRKQQHGGVNNLSLVVSSIERLPAALNDIAHIITINFPWGSLLKGIIYGEKTILYNIASIARYEAIIKIIINIHSFQDDYLRSNLKLPNLTKIYITDVLNERWELFGLKIISSKDLLNHSLPNISTIYTYWERKLTIGSSRNTLTFYAIKI